MKLLKIRCIKPGRGLTGRRVYEVGEYEWQNAHDREVIHVRKNDVGENMRTYFKSRFVLAENGVELMMRIA